MLREPKPAQIMAMEYAFRRSRIALFMEMRLGKNLVTIRWARHHQLDRVLVVAPNDVLEDWRDELIREEVPELDIYVLDGSRIQKFAVAEEIDTGWCIVNYEALRITRHKTGKDFTGAQILDLPWSGIVLDESTAIRSPGTQTTKTLLSRTGHIMHRAILTGLPNPQGPNDYFAQMAFLHGNFMGHYNFWSWRNHFFNEPSWGWEWTPKPDAIEKIKKEVHKTAFFLTRKAAGVGEHRVVERRYVQMTPLQRKLYLQVEKEFAFDTLETTWATVKTIWMARIAGGFSPDQENKKCLNDAKIKAVVNLLKGELSKESVVIWFRFNQELFAMARALDAARIPFTKITGGKKRADNHARKKKFQDGKVQVILMQLKMGRYGWDLSRADTEIRYSEDYDYETFAQSRDRIVSVHKHTALLSISLVTQGTVDEDIVDILNDKSISTHNFNKRLKERLRTAWDLRHPGSDVERKRNPSARREARRVLPGDK